MESPLENTDTFVDAVIKGQTSEVNIPPEACLVEGPLNPRNGDFRRYRGFDYSQTCSRSLQSLPSRRCAGFFHHSWGSTIPDTHAQFRDRIRVALSGMDMSAWDRFAASLYYQPVDFDSPSSFIKLSTSLHALEKQHDLPGNRIFYLAIPPSLYAGMSEMLGNSGL